MSNLIAGGQKMTPSIRLDQFWSTIEPCGYSDSTHDRLKDATHRASVIGGSVIKVVQVWYGEECLMNVHTPIKTVTA